MKLLSITLFCASALGAFAFPSLDPFAYTANANLSGQTNALGEKWYPIGTNFATGIAVVITNDNLTAVSGLPASSGNAVKLVNTNGLSGRFNIPFYASTTNATLFYSVMFKVNDITSLAFATPSTKSGGAFNMGFNNTAGTDAGQSSLPSVFGAPLLMGADGSGGYILGTGRGAGTAGNRFWDTTSHQLGEVVFVVLEYQINVGTTNDIARLWVNPDPSTFNTTTPPTPILIVGDTNDVTTLPSSDADLSAVNSFLLANRNGTTPNDMVVDELRIGTNWAQVTANYVPTAPVPTLSVSLLDSSTVQLSWPGTATGYSLQGTSTLLSSGTQWTAVSGSPSTSGSNFIQNDTIGGSAKFYRLTSPQ